MTRTRASGGTSPSKTIKETLGLSKPSSSSTKTKTKTKPKEEKPVAKYLPTSSEFMDTAESLKVQVGESIHLEAPKKLMSTGSFGWSGSKNGSVSLKNGKKVDVSISINVVVQNSSPSKRKSVGADTKGKAKKGKVIRYHSSSSSSD
ncbi:hypothetical protein L486_03781 [Kwoniella mangroviensis CBS 10435]|uniref:Uncharacterized protein n=1 Tax=Kwoniella mangroviensis CBS 10435 TaxID=1331196 RepID=A0A1B9IUQ6_9TREE|nr:uncharacterized protein I203_02467 [Kwoniella mangroviensis CBS 8507]OCF59278.1 hypothetical protein L486_03781 [Kwoniella mangroviensis CBS 10435]OCF69071.1 hypothetical protein I203_02467 [Kwoniella mangroviensis CBS 8507]OCF76470.1 hypothetical protein I204_02166 [Kwoniella mangroviensis CBS 8886]